MRARLGLQLLSLALLAGCSRANVEQGRYYQCDPSLGGTELQCPGGWFCAKDGFCQDPTVGAPLPCDTTADCTGGWHCGVQHVCYERADAGDVRCRVDVPEDCAPGWKCGLEGFCHSETVAAAYRCDDGSDLWCEQGWRCGPAGVCVDSRLEALRPAPTALEVERLSPTYPFPADELAIANEQSTGDVLAVVRRDGGLWLGWKDYYGVVSSFRQDAPGAYAIAAVDTSAYYADPSGLHRVPVSAVGADPAVSLDPGFPGPYTLRAVSDLRSLLAVASEDRLALIAPGATSAGATYALGGGAQVFDVADVTDRWSMSDSTDEYAVGLVAATDAGLFLAYQSTDGVVAPALPTRWRPVTVPGIGNAFCGAPPGAKPVRVRAEAASSGDYRQWLVTTELDPRDGGAHELLLLQRAEGQPYPTSDCPANADGFTRVLGPLNPCPPSTALVDFGSNVSTWGADIWTAAITARCRGRALDGRQFEDNYYAELLDDGGAYVDRTEPWYWGDLQDGLTQPARANSGTYAVLDATGRLGTCYISSTGWNYLPYCEYWAMDRPPLATSRWRDGGYAPILYVNSASEQFNPSVGFQNFWSSWTPCGRVKGAPELVPFHPDGGDVVLGSPDDFVESWEPVPQTILRGSRNVFPDESFANGLPGAIARLPDGGSIILLAAFDAIWAGHGDRLADGGASIIDARAVPQPRGRITSLAVAGRAPGSPYVDGYAVAQERVFRVEAFSDEQWRTEEIRLPPGRALSVWTDGPWGRAAFADGRVYSLPSGVPIASGLDTARFGEIVDVGELCGHGYALTTRALFQLTADPDGGPVGVWRRVDLSASGLPPEGQLFSGWAPPERDRLADEGQELLLYNEGGTAIRMRDPACSP